MINFVYVVDIYSDYHGYEVRYEGCAVFANDATVEDDIKRLIFDKSMNESYDDTLSEMKSQRRVLGQKVPHRHKVAGLTMSEMLSRPVDGELDYTFVVYKAKLGEVVAAW